MFSKESIKQFLKPDWRKVLVLLIIYLLVLGITDILSEPRFYLSYFLFGDPCSSGCNFLEGNGLTNCPLYDCVSSPIWVEFINIITYYLISCLLISAWDKIKNRSKIPKLK